MDVVKHGLTLSHVKHLIQTSGTPLLEDPWRRTYENRFSMPRDVCAIEKDGLPMIVRFGSTVSRLEAEVVVFVASHTSVPVPEIYGVFSETMDGETITYIVEERLSGTNLRSALSTLDDAARDTITEELCSFLSELSGLSHYRNRLGPIRGPWANSYFRFYQRRMPCDDDTARDTESFLRYFIAYAKTSDITCARASDHIVDTFDLSKPPKFSHGDLQPSNIMIHDSHVSGIVDWAEAGWYPYFWDAFVLFKSIHRELPLFALWFPMARRLGNLDIPEASCMWSLQNLAEAAL